jgi:hypothetical protein
MPTPRHRLHPVTHHGIWGVDCGKKKKPVVPFNSPLRLNLYMESMFFYPERDFLTNRTDNFTFNSVFIPSHKFSDDGAAKTVVDTITLPNQAIVPSVSTTQTTQVVSGGGKPDQATATTATTRGPPKP